MVSLNEALNYVVVKDLPIEVVLSEVLAEARHLTALVDDFQLKLTRYEAPNVTPSSQL